MREDKMIRHGTAQERDLIAEIRRATNPRNEEALLEIAHRVGQLSESAIKRRDTSAVDSLERVLWELRSAVRGGKSRPILEYKDCAVALSSGARFESRARVRKEREFGGYGSTFGGPPDSYGDVIERGAFRKSLARHRAAGTLPKLFWSHDPRWVPGKWLEMEEDSYGLAAEGLLAKTQTGLELDELIRMDAVDALSIGFAIPEGGARWDSKGQRIITEIDLHEISLVSMPANGRARLTSSVPDNYGDSYSQLQSSLRALQSHLSAEQKKPAADNVIAFPERDDANLLASADRLLRSIKRCMK